MLLLIDWPPADQIDRPYLEYVSRLTGIPLHDLVALGGERDPFLAGTPTQTEDAAKFVAFVTGANIPPDTHLRDVHYKLLHAEVGYERVIELPANPTDAQRRRHGRRTWEWLQRASRAARDLGDVVPWAFPDRRTRRLVADGRGDGEEVEYAVVKPTFYVPTKPTTIQAKIDGWVSALRVQRVRVLVLIEKDADSLQREVVRPCVEAGAELVITTGFTPKTLAGRLAQEALADERPLVVFLITDADFDGDHMPTVTARHIEHIRSLHPEVPPIYVSEIALTLEQVREIEAKTGRPIPLAPDRVEGRGRVELNALPVYAPGWLRRRVEEALAEVTVEVAEPDAELPAELEEKLDRATQLARRAYERVEDRLREIEEIVDANLAEWEPDEIEVDVAEPSMQRDWILGSERDYGEQLNRYRARKGLPPLAFDPRVCALEGCERTMEHRSVQARYCSHEHTREAERRRRRR